MSPAATSTHPDHALRVRIVDAARELFLERGYSQVSTIEIADALGMSKKTLYREFETKEEILRAVVIPKLKESSKRIDAIIADRALPYPDKLQAILAILGVQQQRVSPVLIRDVTNHAPEVWHEIQEHKRARLKKFETLLREGIALGYFRSDIPSEVIVRMHTASVEALMTPQALGELPCTSSELFQNIVSVLFEGILREGKRKSFTGRLNRNKKAISDKG
ncbi:MAG: TetR/AcrR family transcriptional regulator [Bacteroidota bacterium]|nr:TetR/AcrR family transcriptional regulator [Bacteroidota bacterium]MDP4233615.1 TetR/AcrR family transcriptional regulator [Bacteroidota bacterium]MDP4243125.1 TetR/AcrR family transcriptional regulator [Bacteroidota bacterium]MDP4288543.1 TetR/AcrR family transcriptional regulator [Bacteroidota bacterium]